MNKHFKAWPARHLGLLGVCAAVTVAHALVLMDTSSWGLDRALEHKAEPTVIAARVIDASPPASVVTMAAPARSSMSISRTLTEQEALAAKTEARETTARPNDDPGKPEAQEATPAQIEGSEAVKGSEMPPSPAMATAATPSAQEASTVASTGTPVQAAVPQADAQAATVVALTEASGLKAPAGSKSMHGLPFIPPPSAWLNYSLTGQYRGLSYYASGELSWQHTGQDYQLRQVVSAFLIGKRVNTSQGKLGRNGLAPMRFVDQWRNERVVHFDHGNNRIVFSATTEPAPYLAGAQDMLSVFIQLSGLVLAAPERYPVGSRLWTPIATVRDVLPGELVRQSDESLAWNGQEEVAQKWTRMPRHERDVRIELWLLPSLSYLPARIKVVDSNANVVDLTIEKVRLPPSTASG